MSIAKDVSEKIKAEIESNHDIVQYILQHTGKTMRGSKIQCPFHTEDTASFHIYAETKSYHCFGCDESGDIIEFVKKFNNLGYWAAVATLGIDISKYWDATNGNAPDVDMSTVPSEPPIVRPKSGNMQEFALSRKIPVEAYTKWGCKDIVYDDWIDGKSIKRNAIAIPTRDGVDRLRFLTGKGAKYKPNNGQRKTVYGETRVKAQWFGLDRVLGQKKNFYNPDKIIVFCNGQTSVMAAHWHGVPAICQTDGENKIHQHLIDELREHLENGWKLWIALDSDKKGVDKTKQIYMQLYEYHPKSINLDGPRGYDLGDFCIKHGDLSLEKLNGMRITPPIDIAQEHVIGLVKASDKLTRAIEGGQKNIEPVIASVQQTIDNITQGIKVLDGVSGKDAIEKSYAKYIEAKDNPSAFTGFDFGITKLNYSFGGFQKGEFTQVLAETGSGKSSLVAGFAVHLMGQAAGIVCAAEGGETEFSRRMAAYLSEIPHGHIKRGGRFNDDKTKFTPLNEKEHGDIGKAYRNLKRFQDNLRFTPPGSPTITALKDMIKRYIHEMGAEWIIIDSGNNVLVPGSDGIFSTSQTVAYQLEEIALKNDIAVLSTIHGGRNTKGRSVSRLRLSDNQGGSAWEQKAAYHMSIYNHHEEIARGNVKAQTTDITNYPDGTARFYINKVRDDSAGNFFTVRWNGGVGFSDWAKGQ